MKSIFNKVLCMVLICVSCFSSQSRFFVHAEVDNVSQDAVGQSALEMADGFNLILENDRLALYVNVSTGNFCVADTEANQIWYAFPPDVDERVVYSYESMRSMMDVTFSFESNALMTVGSYDEDGSMTRKIFKLKDGLRFEFHYDRDGITFMVPMRVMLSNDSLTCSVDYEAIEEGEDVLITDIAPLPNFGTGSCEQDGYAFIPDGSGILANFADAKDREVTYSYPVYGADASQDLSSVGFDQELRVRMPVFGFKHRDGAFLAIIEKGDTDAMIKAAEKENWLFCSASFTYRDADRTSVQTKDGDSRVMEMISETHLSTSPVVHYIFLADANANYSGMASAYRSYLVEEGHLTKRADKSSGILTIEAFGGAYKDDSLLGIVPYKKLVKATTFSQLADMQSKLGQVGVTDSQWILYGFLKGGYENQGVSSYKYDNRLGGRDAKETIHQLGANRVFTVVDVLKEYSSSTPLFNLGGRTKSLNQTTVTHAYRKLSNGGKVSNFGIWTYRSISSFKKCTDKIIKRAPEGAGLVFGGIGEELYNDFSDDNRTGRSQLLQTYNELVDSANQKSQGIACEGGNLYAALKANFVYEVPITGTGHEIESVSVPFYSMVLHSYIPLSSSPINHFSDQKDAALLAFEQGVAITTRMTGCDPYELQDTKLNFLYNTSTEGVLELASFISKEEYTQPFSNLVDVAIASHRYEGDFSITSYENGWMIVANHGDSNGIFNGQNVASGSYILVK